MILGVSKTEDMSGLSRSDSVPIMFWLVWIGFLVFVSVAAVVDVIFRGYPLFPVIATDHFDPGILLTTITAYGLVGFLKVYVDRVRKHATKLRNTKPMGSANRDL